MITQYVGVVGLFFNVLSLNSWPLLHPHTQTHNKKRGKTKQNKSHQYILEHLICRFNVKESFDLKL